MGYKDSNPICQQRGLETAPRQLSSVDGNCWITGECSGNCASFPDSAADKGWQWEIGSFKLCVYKDSNPICQQRGLKAQEPARQLSSVDGNCWITGECSGNCASFPDSAADKCWHGKSEASSCVSTRIATLFASKGDSNPICQQRLLGCTP